MALAGKFDSCQCLFIMDRMFLFIQNRIFKRAERISFLNFDVDDSSRVIACGLLMQTVGIQYKAGLFAGFSAPVIIRHFGKYAGLTPADYRRKKRISQV